MEYARRGYPEGTSSPRRAPGLATGVHGGETAFGEDGQVWAMIRYQALPRQVLKDLLGRRVPPQVCDLAKRFGINDV